MDIIEVPLHTSIGPHLGIKEEIPQYMKPGLMPGKNIIEFCSNSFHFWQPTTWDVRKVVMFHVIANIEGEIIPGTVVRVGLIASVKHIMFGDKMSGHGMDTQAK